MTKSKKQNTFQLLSPENYIRKKALNLPIHECKINDNWEEMGTAQIVISRIHANGNLTFAMYMVDLLCMGIRDSLYGFNQSKEEYEELLDTMSEDLVMIDADYILVHNIIFAAREFADELGFKPHKDFTLVTQYMLEEDTDDIELIEIECGRNGKPLFIHTENSKDSEANRIIKQLEKAVGKGNFDVIFGEDGDEIDFDDVNEYSSLDADERRNIFEQLTKNGVDSLSDENHRNILKLTDAIYLYDMCDDETVENLLEKWESEIDPKIDEEDYTLESLGIEADITLTEADMDEFDNADENIEEKPLTAKLQLDELRSKWGNIPYICYLELKLLENNDNPKEYKIKLNEYAALYPDFPLFKIEKFKTTLSEGSKINLDDFSFEKAFGGRSTITSFEMFEYLLIWLISLHESTDFNTLEALYVFLDGVDINEDFIDNLKAILIIQRINVLKEYFNKVL